MAEPFSPVSAGTVEWFAGYSTTFSDDDEIEFTVLVGQAAPDVHGLRVETADERYEHPVHHPPGLVVIAAVGPALVTAPGNEP